MSSSFSGSAFAYCCCFTFLAFFLSSEPSIKSDILFTKSIPNIDTVSAIIPPDAIIIVPTFSNRFISGIVTIAPIAPPPAPLVPSSKNCFITFSMLLFSVTTFP